MTNSTQKILKSIKSVEKWVEANDYKGYEPFDGSSSFLRPLTFGNLFLDRLLIQLIRQSPINLRPFLGIKPLDSTIGRGYMASGYLTIFKLTGNNKYKNKAVNCLEWLIENKAPGFADYSWGKHFDVAGRGGRYSKLEPITVWTSIIGLVFMDAFEILGAPKYLEVSESICKWILELPKTKTHIGICLNYTGLWDQDCTIYNQSMLAAAMLARTAKFTGNGEYLLLAKQAMDYTCSNQLSEGAWYYGEAPMYHWIDNFHTGYNLDALKCYIDNTSDKSFDDNLCRGYKYFKNHFFGIHGEPRYYHNRTHPIDIQCASQAIDTLANFSEYDESSLELASKTAKWTIDNMQDEKGFFYYRKYPLIKAKIPMLHWGQATMYKALTHLLSKI